MPIKPAAPVSLCMLAAGVSFCGSHSGAAAPRGRPNTWRCRSSQSCCRWAALPHWKSI